MGSFITGFATATIVFAVVGAATEFFDTLGDVIRAPDQPTERT